MPDLRLREAVSQVVTLCLVPCRAASLLLPNFTLILMANPKVEQYREEKSARYNSSFSKNDDSVQFTTIIVIVAFRVAKVYSKNIYQSKHLKIY